MIPETPTLTLIRQALYQELQTRNYATTHANEPPENDPILIIWNNLGHKIATIYFYDTSIEIEPRPAPGTSELITEHEYANPDFLKQIKVRLQVLAKLTPG